ncbi:hypothetical protein SORBI_3001G048500 [Sorghum bicolor]|uniref:Pheophorbide a oxygenase domain-containing protein n=1 Tax=Sorghum bicolor TaxID=4558 RepID=C5WW65_SORBI|nr:hypothetical protein SORBI_3001G048500 [Sorghum bicolor]
MKLKIEEASIDGFLASMERGHWKFMAPCTFHSSGTSQQEEGASVHARRLLHPGGSLGPGRSRLIWAFPRNFGVWLDMVVPRWVYHIAQNRVLDSDAYILHVEVATEMSERSTMHASLTCCIQYISVNSNMLELQERKFAAMGLENWQSRCYVPASSDAMVVAFRRWFRKHSKNQPGGLPPTATKDRLMERYWSHVAQCASCSAALRAMRAAEAALQVASVAAVGFLAVARESALLASSPARRAVLVCAAVLCFAASRWLAGFIQSNFFFQPSRITRMLTSDVTRFRRTGILRFC